MGLFSGVGKAFKKVWRGIEKRFKKTLAEVGKFLNSKIGKVLLLAVSVFTMGSAMVAAQGAYAAASAGGASFVQAFVQGGKAFVQTLVGAGAEEAAAPAASEAAAQATAAQGAVSSGDVLAGVDAAATATEAGGALGGVGNVSEVAAEGAGMLTQAGEAIQGAQGVTSAAENVLKTGALQGPSGQALQLGEGVQKGWLTKAADAAKSFAKSAGSYVKTDEGQRLLGSLLQGYGRGQEISAFERMEDAAARSFRNPNNRGMRSLAAHDFNIDVPAGLSGASNRLAQSQNRNSGRYRPSVSYGG